MTATSTYLTSPTSRWSSRSSLEPPGDTRWRIAHVEAESLAVCAAVCLLHAGSDHHPAEPVSLTRSPASWDCSARQPTLTRRAPTRQQQAASSVSSGSHLQQVSSAIGPYSICFPAMRQTASRVGTKESWASRPMPCCSMALAGQLDSLPAFRPRLQRSTTCHPKEYVCVRSTHAGALSN